MFIVPLQWIEYGVYGDLIIIYPKPDSIYIIPGGSKSSSSFGFGANRFRRSESRITKHACFPCPLHARKGSCMALHNVLW